MKKKLVLGLTVLALMLSSCGLLPEEETLPPVPVIRDYEKQEYKQTQVQRGDLVLSKSVACTYDIVMQEHLSFFLRIFGHFTADHRRHYPPEAIFRVCIIKGMSAGYLGGKGAQN